MLLSLVLHVILALALWTDVLWPNPPAEPKIVNVDLVPETAKPPPLKAEPPKAPEPKAEEPKPPEPPKPPEAPKPPEPKPVPRPMATPPPVVKIPPKFQAEQGKLGKESKLGARDEVEPKPQTEPVVRDPIVVSPKAPPTEPMAFTTGQKRLADGGPTTQSERDLLLTQILGRWKHPSGDWPPNVVVQLRVRILPDGHMAAPFDSRDKYTPNEAITGYESMGYGDPRLQLLETLYVAIRVAQPLTLPPELKAKAPFETVLDFKLSDVIE